MPSPIVPKGVHRFRSPGGSLDDLDRIPENELKHLPHSPALAGVSVVAVARFTDILQIMQLLPQDLLRLGGLVNKIWMAKEQGAILYRPQPARPDR